MRKMLLRFLLCLPAAAMLAPGGAAAQGVFNMGMLTNTLSQGGSTQSESARASTSNVFRSMTRVPRSATVNRAAITYRPSTTVRQRNMLKRHASGYTCGRVQTAVVPQRTTVLGGKLVQRGA